MQVIGGYIMMEWRKSHDRNKKFIITVLSGLMTCLILVGGGYGMD